MNIQPPALPSLATFIISILIALGVTATIWAYGQKDPEQIYSPMPITNAHKTAKKCSDCHDPWKGVSDDKCIKCHPLSELKDPTDPDAMKFAGIHRKAINDNQSCLDCHTEHLGKNSKITKNFDHSQLGNNLNCLSCHQSDSPKNDLHQNIKGQNCSTCHTTDTWKNAKFDHAKSGFPLTGKHTDVSCKECHKTGEFKKLDKNCFACHQQDDKHNGSMGNNCAQCHNTIKWSDVSFVHNKFPLSGEHRGISCQECHPNRNNYREFTCLSCHEHSQDRMDRKHKGEVRGYNYDSQACYKCHPQGTEHEGGEHGEGGEDD